MHTDFKSTFKTITTIHVLSFEFTKYLYMRQSSPKLGQWNKGTTPQNKLNRAIHDICLEHH